MMPDLSTLALFSLACLALAATPGPDMLLIATRSVSQGRSAGFASLAGIQAGTYCHAVAAALGLSQLFLLVPIVYDAVRYTGAAYLLYLAWQAFRSSLGTMSVKVEASRYSNLAIFRQGLITNVLNPKMALFVLALFPQFVRPEHGLIAAQILLLATVLNIVGFVVNGIVILTATRIRRAMSGASRFRPVSQWFLGTVFVGLAARLAVDSRK